MKIHLNVEYQTTWGEELRVMLELIDKDGHRDNRILNLTTEDGSRWKCDVDVDSSYERVEYIYAMYRNGSLIWTEWEVAPHVVVLDNSVDQYEIEDLWRAIPDDLPLYSSAYADCAERHEVEDYLTHTSDVSQLRTVEPRLLKGERLAIIGNVSQLGNWVQPQTMKLVALQEWAINIDLSQISGDIEYKYVIVDKDGNIVQWEKCDNRRLQLPEMHAEDIVCIKSDTRPKFDIRPWKCAGVVIPVFSIRSEKSAGIGDFGDLERMIEWASGVGMRAVQILPINDTTKCGEWTDSYPYNAISIYAFHPIYCDLHQLGELDDKELMEDFKKQWRELNSLKYVDYVAVNKCKRRYIRMMYEQNGEEVLASDGFKEFFEKHRDWLVPYSAYSCMRDMYGLPDFTRWEEHSKYDKNDVEMFCSKDSIYYHDVAHYYYIQYQLHLQLKRVHECAREKGVILKGDIPIGISRDSVEAWMEPFYFNLNGQAGAPPDDFSVNGQNWGFPTYNWDVMAKDNYQWWSHRFKSMSEYFDAYRIDHVLGFFRIWEIPSHSVHGLLGQFSPALPMSEDEMSLYGFRFDKDRMTEPYISDEMLEHYFDEMADEVREKYLVKRFDGLYCMKPEYDTQRKVEAAFYGRNDDVSIKVRDGLYALISNVLFVADRNNPKVYHPRISAQLDFAYKAMNTAQRRAFNSLYDDYYYKRHNQFWYDEAMKKLPHLTQATRMLVCAEDLGMVPDCVPWVMKQLRMLSLEIQTMPKKAFCEFGDLTENPYLSVSTISTHDMPTLRGWWEEDRRRAQLYYNNVLHESGNAPEKISGALCEEIIRMHLECPSMICLLSLQDWTSMDENLRYPVAGDERINVPADPKNQWKYRMHFSIEDLMKNESFNSKVASLIRENGR